MRSTLGPASGRHNDSGLNARNSARSSEPSSARQCAVFLVNRDEQHPATVEIDVTRLQVSEIAECTTLSDDDPFASNTFDAPERVVPRDNTTATLSEGLLTLLLPPVSWTAIALTP